MPRAGEALDLLGVPVAGVGERRPPASSVTPAAASSRSVAVTIGSSCPKSAESIVTSAAITIWSSVQHRLGVVALHPAARRLDVARVGIGQVDLARRRVGRLVGLGRAAEAAPVLHHPARAVGLVFGVRAPLDVEVLLEPAPGFDQPLRRASAAPVGPARRAARSSRRWASRSHRCRPSRVDELPAAARRRGARRTARLRARRSRRPVRGSRARSARSRASRAQTRSPCTFVPSTATTPTRTSPASAHSPSTWPNSSPSARSWRTRKRAIVA